MLPYPRHARRAAPRDQLGRILAMALAIAVFMPITACGGSVETRGGAVPPTAASGDPRRLAGVCPATIVMQTSWYPESTHGGLYQLLGARYSIDKAHTLIRGPLVSSGVGTGVELEIRAGGPARGSQPVSALMAADQSITLGQQATEEQVLGWAVGQPTVAVLAPFQVDPVVFIWDANRHPGWNTVQDIGQTDYTVYTFRSANTDYLLGAGILRAHQVNYSYDGSPSYFMARPDSAVGGFSTNEPFIYRSLGRNVAYAYVADTGYPDYRNAITVRRGDLERLAPCLRRLVPILQRGMVEFMTRPDPVLGLIVELNRDYTASFPYPLAQARSGVKVMRDDGLVGNGPGDVFGAFKPDRLQRMIDILRPIYTARGQRAPGDLTADTIATNDYLDPGVRLKTS